MSTLCKNIVNYISDAFHILLDGFGFDKQVGLGVFDYDELQLFGLLVLIVVGVCVVFSILNLLANLIRLKG